MKIQETPPCLKIRKSPSSLAVVGSDDDPSASSSEPPQASSRHRRISAKTKTPRKRGGLLILLQSLRSLGRGGVARPHSSTRRGITCLRTRRGGVDDPAGLPAWPPVRLHRCRWLGVSRGCANGKKTPARGRGPSTTAADGRLGCRTVLKSHRMATASVSDPNKIKPNLRPEVPNRC